MELSFYQYVFLICLLVPIWVPHQLIVTFGIQPLKKNSQELTLDTKIVYVSDSVSKLLSLSCKSTLLYLQTLALNCTNFISPFKVLPTEF